MSTRTRRRGLQVRALAAVSLSLAAGPASARLGGPRESVEADRAHFAASLSTVQRTTHAVHTLSLPNGGTIREFTRADGVVFAVAWRGPGRPDLRQLLGADFDALQAANVAPRGRRTRRPLTLDRGDLQIVTGGHPGAFWGMAWRPGLAPQGFSTRSLSPGSMRP